jgi:hypothetical protein
VISTLALILLGIVAVLLAGYGPTLLLLERKENRSRAVAIPVVGLACYIVATHFLASLHFAGGVVSLGALIALVALAFGVPRDRRLERQEIGESLAVFAICGAGLLLAAWPLLREGYASYLAFGNADAAFNLGVNEGLLRYGYGSRLSDFPSFWPNPLFAHMFGGGYICVLLAVVTGTDIFKLHDVVAASIVFVVPAAVFLFSVVCLRASRRTALIAAAGSALSSQICYTFYLQSFGALTFMALLPGFLAVFTEALDRKGFRPILCAALLFTGASFGYYAAFAVMVLLLVVQTVVALAKRTIQARELWRVAIIFAAVALLAYPALMVSIFRRSVVESGSSRLVTSLNGPEVLLSFAFALTEQYASFFWGLSIPPLAANSPFEPPSWAYLLALGLGVLLTGVVLWLIFRPRSAVRTETRMQMGILLVVVAYYFISRIGYGAFKLAGWLNPVFFAFLICGIVPTVPLSDGSKWFARCRYGLLLAMVSLNVGWAIELGRCSLSTNAGASGKSLAGFTAHDFEGLSSLGKAVPADARILVAIPDVVVQRWVLTYLKRGNVSVLPYLSFSPNEPDSSEQIAASGADSATYILTWWGPGDVISTAIEHPLWHNTKFQLAPVDSIKDFLMMGRGWYRMERIPGSTEQWQHQFRGLRSSGELILLNGSGEEKRLRLTIASSYGLPFPDRSISIALNGEKFDEIRTSGIATVITKPFRASGFLNSLSISLPDKAQPAPSRWGLIRRWVPKDGRRLNVAVANVELIGDQEYSAIRMPCRIDFTRQDDWKVPGIDGLYGDHWIAGEAHVSLQPCSVPDAVSVDGFIPMLPHSRPPFSVIVSVDGAPHIMELTKAGPFRISIPLPGTALHDWPYEIAVRAPRTFVPAELGLGTDRRRLSIKLNFIELRLQGAAAGERAGSGATGRTVGVR